MGDRLHPLPFASTGLFPCAWCLVLLCMTTNVLVDDFSAHIDKISVGVEPHFDSDVI